MTPRSPRFLWEGDLIVGWRADCGCLRRLSNDYFDLTESCSAHREAFAQRERPYTPACQHRDEEGSGCERLAVWWAVDGEIGEEAIHITPACEQHAIDIGETFLRITGRIEGWDGCPYPSHDEQDEWAEWLTEQLAAQYRARSRLT